MKVGLLGGMFDPIRLGHLRAAESAREALDLGEVLFVPVGLERGGPSYTASAVRRRAQAGRSIRYLVPVAGFVTKRGLHR